LIYSFRWVGLPLILLLVLAIGYLPMSWQQQFYFGALLIGGAIVAGRMLPGRAGTLIMVLFSMCATTRYAMWRIGSLVHYFTSPWQVVNRWNALFMLLLIGAEAYSFLILYLGYMQTIAPLRRPPVAMPGEQQDWPTVDLMIPTYNEPMEVVRYTALAAKQLDWPEDKLKIFILDDGDREEFRKFAQDAGVGYIARPEHSHAKAGNINYALARTTGDLVAIFDCDHVPTRSFLQVTVGWFLRDLKLAMLQTPHHFYSADPFERNLGNFRRVPNEGELFYGIIQDTNDLWNATFFCGSCAVIRREALMQVGGIAQETVTEDAHTSLRMQKLGWNTAYINLAQAAGLATETLGGHIKQRVRWARGMAQILRTDNPLLARGLNLPQRLCYLTAMLHFMYALPRLVFLSAPILYLVFGKLNIPGYWVTILVFALPHLVMATMTNSRIQGEKRYSFWNEIYESVLSPYILLPTLFAMISPKFGKFNVTAKGQNTMEDYFDSKLARPFLAILGLNALGLAMAVPRYLYWDRMHPGTILMNVLWTCFNCVIMGAALSICWEKKQMRTSVRVTTKLPVMIENGGVVCAGSLVDMSVSGAAVMVAGRFSPGERVTLNFPSEDADTMFPARIVGIGSGQVRVFFDMSSLEQQEAITRVLYLAADRWLDWSDGRRRDSIFGSLLGVFAASFRGFGQMIGLMFRRKSGGKSRMPALARNVATILLILGAVFFLLRRAHGETPLQTRSAAGHAAGALAVELPLREMGAREGILLDSTNRNQAIAIALPDDVLMDSGTLHLKYTLPESKEATSTLEVLLNDTMLAAITPSATELALGHGEATIPLPVELLVRQNRLTLRLSDAAETGSCLAVQPVTAPIQVDADTVFELHEEHLVLANDLSLLPEPFVQRTAAQGSKLPVVFATQPTGHTLQAAGVLASWFGSQAQQGQTLYSVSLGSLPLGNAVVLLTDGQSIPGLATAATDQASITTMANPIDPYGKLLVLAAKHPDELLALTQALSLGQLSLSGEKASMGSLRLPPRRMPDDAPRWIHTRRVSLQAFNGGAELNTVDSNPLNLYLRFSPDYNYGPNRDIYVHLDYGTDAAALDPRSNLVIRLNGVPADSVPVRGSKGKVKQQANLALGPLPASVFANTLQAQFYFVPPSGRDCGSNHFAGRIGSSSFLDLGEASHLAQLPELHLFSNAGFPFTRIADLGETAVLLPEHATEHELNLYLDLLSYFASQTGYPALRVETGTISEAARFGGDGQKDLLVLGANEDLQAMPEINKRLPLQLGSDGWQLSKYAQVGETFQKTLRRIRTAVFGGVAPEEEEDIAPGGVLEQIRSPYASDRSLVLLLARDADALEPMTAALMEELPHDGITGSVSLWEGGNFVSHDYSTPGYALGDVDTLTKLKILLPDHPWLLMIGFSVIVFALSLWLEIWLQSRIRRRLMGVPFNLDGKPNPGALQPETVKF
jgi:cellulose synthase (UDP-forming)